MGGKGRVKRKESKGEGVPKCVFDTVSTLCCEVRGGGCFGEPEMTPVQEFTLLLYAGVGGNRLFCFWS